MELLNGKTAVVTGGTRGIGLAIVRVFLQNGAKVALCGSRMETAEKAVTALKAENADWPVIGLAPDLTDFNAVQAAIQTACETFGGVDILVNNAGTTKAQDIFETSEADWDFILQTNLKSLFLMCKRAMEIMREQKSGRIINMSSIVAYRGALFGHVHYAATKAGILGFTRTLARTGAPYNITVNALAPGIIETELLFQTHGAEGVAKLAKTVPLGLGKVRDVGLAAAFLSGEGGRYLTGLCLDINGGMNFH